METIENSHRNSGQAEKQNVRKHDPVQIRCQLELAWRRRESRGEHAYEHWRKHHPNDCQNGHDYRGERQQRVREFPRFLFLALAEVLGKYRNERRVCSTFADNASKKIWNPVGDRERVGGIVCSQKISDPLIARVTEDSTKNGECADGAGGPEQLSVFAHSTR